MNTHSQDATLPQEGAPWLEPWPTDQLEALRKCPICGNSSREILHADLVDNTFFCAPGIWKMWSCKTCSAAYLAPRPTPLSIGLAFKSYYTHAPNSVSRKDFGQLSVFRKFRRMLVNGYTNWRGLEAPRHLVLFSRKTLYRALSRAGFDAIRQMPDRNVYRHMYTKSHAMRSNERPDTKAELPLSLDLMARLARLSGAIALKRHEFLTFTAEKK